MSEELDITEFDSVEDFLKPACYADDVYETVYETVVSEPDADYENLYALPC